MYLFEVVSVTLGVTRDLSRAFRNLQGNYLLVLTSDYERIDFVLVDKSAPKSNGGGIGQAQVGVRPRTLTVDRKKPEAVQLRVLRRFTYTEADPLAQYEKLKSAYAIADWSEEFFNNKALFSDHFLLTRLREEFAAWREDPKPAYRAILDLYRGARGRFGNLERSGLTGQLYQPLFESLGFSLDQKRGSGKQATAEPDFRLLEPESRKLLTVCLAYPWGRSLDAKDEQRDSARPDENPGAAVVSVLQKGAAEWAIVTNGKVWRLYSASTHSRATNYYEIDLEETLAAENRSPGEVFRYFWLLFRREAFEALDAGDVAGTEAICFLDKLRLGSQEYAKELGERLKERIFVDVFPHLTQGFIDCIRSEEGTDASLDSERLDRIYRGTLTLLYRLLFLFYAESRGLLPAKELRGYYQVSLKKVKEELAMAAGTIADDVPDRLKRHYRTDSYELWDWLVKLWEVVDNGEAELNVPFYNGGLFVGDPPSDDSSPEAANARFLRDTRADDRRLALVIDLLARDPDPKRHDLVFLDY